MPHYYSEEQTSELKLAKISISAGGISFPMFSGSGVFSKSSLDKGTQVLLEGMIMKDGLKVLDLGCGIGVVGVYVKKKFPKTELVMSDVNSRAVFLADKNAKLNNIDAETLQSDGFAKIKEEFDAILLNPPQVAGKETCFRLFEESYHHLKKKGFLQIVARHNKGGKTYSEKLKELFGKVEKTAKGSGYTVYFSQKNS